MIERLGASATEPLPPATQPATDPPAPGVLNSRQAELLVDNVRPIEELNWIGAMNAFRIAGTLEAQQQLFATTRSGTALAELQANPDKGGLIPHQTVSLLATNQADPTLIPAIVQMDEDHKASNDLGSRPENGRATQLLAANREMVDGFTEVEVGVALSSEANTVTGIEVPQRQIRDPLSVKAKTNADTAAETIATRPAVFRGRLVRIGQTSQFLPDPQT